MKAFTFWLFLTCSLCSKEPILLLMGAPGSGKGTFAQYLKEHHSFVHCSIGDLVRLEIDQRTPFGKSAEIKLLRGDFLEEGMIQSLIKRQIEALSENLTPFILDGFPRTTESAHFLHDLFCELGLEDRVVTVLLESSDSTCEQRILDRIICKQCGYVYSRTHSLFEVKGACNQCKAPLSIRLFDDPSTVRTRLEKYHSVTVETVLFCMDQYPFVHFSTEVPIEECYAQYNQFLKELDL